MSAPTVGAQVFGGVVCPLLALEVRPMFQARGQAREKRDIKHREEETLVQACPCSLIADIEHHTWFFDISCDQVDFKCVPCCLPRSCRKHSGNVCFISLLAFPWCCICNGKKVFNLPACGVLRIGALPLVFGLHSVAHCIVARLCVCCHPKRQACLVRYIGFGAQSRNFIWQGGRSNKDGIPPAESRCWEQYSVHTLQRLRRM